MEMFIKDNGKMIKHMEKACIQIMINQAIQDNGFKIFSMDLAFKNGLMDLLIKGKNLNLFR
jgi:hypothetical protein